MQHEWFWRYEMLWLLLTKKFQHLHRKLSEEGVDSEKLGYGWPTGLHVRGYGTIDTRTPHDGYFQFLWGSGFDWGGKEEMRRAVEIAEDLMDLCLHIQPGMDADEQPQAVREALLIVGDRHEERKKEGYTFG